MDDVIRARLAARPFIPFRLTLTGGTFQDVTEPESVEVDGDTTGDGVVRVFRRAPDQPGGRVWQTIISLPHVLSVEDAGDLPILVTSGG